MTFQTQTSFYNTFNLNMSSDTDDPIVSYWYEGHCPNTGKLLRLPRTHQIEAIARELMKSLAEDPIFSKEGKMYGVLLVESQNGNQVLKAFSGLLQGQSQKEGWVPPISGQEKLVLIENQTLAELEVIKQQILQYQFIPKRQEYERLSQDFSQQLVELNLIHAQRKEERKKQREFLFSNSQNEEIADQLNELQEQSKRDGMEKRCLKRQRDEVLKPLQRIIQEADQTIQQLKQERKMRSRQLQTQMHCT